MASPTSHCQAKNCGINCADRSLPKSTDICRNVASNLAKKYNLRIALLPNFNSCLSTIKFHLNTEFQRMEKFKNVQFPPKWKIELTTGTTGTQPFPS